MAVGKIVVISGPSGVGKSTLVRKLCENPGVVKTVTATTRAKRPGEMDGKDYSFYSREDFEKAIQKGAFIEHATIFGQGYGTPRKGVEERLKTHRVVILEIDVQGVQSLKKLGYDCFYIYLLPPDMDALKERLAKRRSEGEREAAARLKAAEHEMAHKNLYDVCIVNDDMDKTVRDVTELLKQRNILA